MLPHRRPLRKGSFDGHFDELVTVFPAQALEPRHERAERDPKLQEKIDIHALLFRRAWQLED